MEKREKRSPFFSSSFIKTGDSFPLLFLSHARLWRTKPVSTVAAQPWPPATPQTVAVAGRAREKLESGKDLP